MASRSSAVPRHALSAAAIVLALCAGEAAAQAADARASRERELLRRAQAALQQAQSERDALAAEKTALQVERDKLRDESARRDAELDALRAQLERGRSDASRLDATLAETRREAEAQAARSAARDAEQSQAIARLQRELAERTAANQRLVALLEATTRQRDDAETRNRQLHALGHELVDLWWAKTADEAASQSEPLFGFGRVRAETRAQALRDQVDALRAPPRAP
jgi:dTMP kinase